MIGLEEGNNVFLRALISLKYLYVIIHYFQRIQHVGDLIDLRLIPILLLHKSIELLLIRLGNNIPNLAASTVIVVDGVDVGVLDVPAKAGEHHADVDPRNSDAADVLVA